VLLKWRRFSWSGGSAVEWRRFSWSGGSAVEVAGVLPVLQKMTDREQNRPKMLPVLQFLYDREHLKGYFRCDISRNE